MFSATGSNSTKVPTTKVDDVGGKDQTTPYKQQPSTYHVNHSDRVHVFLQPNASVSFSNRFLSKKHYEDIRHSMNMAKVIIIALVFITMCVFITKYQPSKKVTTDTIQSTNDILEKYNGNTGPSSSLYTPDTIDADGNEYDHLRLDLMKDIYRKLSDFNSGQNILDQKTTLDDVIYGYDQNFKIHHKDSTISFPLSITKSAYFINDFIVNVTVIVDDEEQHCFVLPLMRKTAPRSLFDFMFKTFLNDNYFTDLKKFMSNKTRFVKLTATDISVYGSYISTKCAEYSTFKLDKVETAADV